MAGRGGFGPMVVAVVGPMVGPTGERDRRAGRVLRCAGVVTARIVIVVRQVGIAGATAVARRAVGSLGIASACVGATGVLHAARRTARRGARMADPVHPIHNAGADQHQREERPPEHEASHALEDRRPHASASITNVLEEPTNCDQRRSQRFCKTRL